MKLRISEGTLRFRLNPQDVQSLREDRVHRGELRLTPDLSWRYGIRLASDLENTRLTAWTSGIDIEVPETPFLDWLDGTDIEWEHLQAEPRLRILIEKDLKPHRE